MTVRFIQGRSGAGKTTHCIDEIVRRLQDLQNEEKLIFLVPEQATYQMEKAILQRCKGEAYSRLYVLSFSRLSYWVSKIDKTLEPISKAGKRMVILRIIRENSHRLNLLAGNSALNSLVEKIAELITEFYNYNISPSDLANLANKLENGESSVAYSVQKYLEIAFVYDQYLRFIENRFRDSDAYLSEILEGINESDFLNNSSLWIDGFSSFSPAEVEVIAAMALKCKSSSMAICLATENYEYPVFYPATQTKYKLVAVFQEQAIATEDVSLKNIHRWAERSKQLEMFEMFLANDDESIQALGDDIVLLSALGEREEVERVAEKIVSMVSGEGYKYEDFGIIASDLDKYQLYLKTIFKDYGIPLFIDMREPLIDNPFAKLIVSALEFVIDGFKTTELLAYLKNPNSGVSFEDAICFENQLLSGSIGGKRILTELQKQPNMSLISDFASEIVARTDEYIEIPQFAEILSKFINGHLGNDSPDYVSVATGAVEKIISEMGAIFSGRLKLLALVDIVRNELLSGQLGVIPAMDIQVIAGDVRRARKPELKVIFVLGVESGSFPYPGAGGGLLSDFDRGIAYDNGVDMSVPIEERITTEKFLTYIAMTRASEKLFVSWSLACEKKSGPAGVVKSLCSLTQSKPANSYLASLKDYYLPPAVLADRVADRYLREEISEQSIRDVFSDDAIVRGLDYNNACKIDSVLINRLYKGDCEIAVMAIQDYAECPYKFFASRILRTKQRIIGGFTPLSKGNFIHEAMDILSKKLIDLGMGFEADPLILLEIVDDVVQEYLSQNNDLSGMKNKDLHSLFVLDNYCDKFKNLVLSAHKMALAGKFHLSGSEVCFGKDSKGALLLYEDNNCKVWMKGVIDRFDIARVDGIDVVFAIDYKSPSHKIQNYKVINGIDIQLLLYTIALKKMGYTPAGFAYQPYEPDASEDTEICFVGDRNMRTIKTRGFINGKYVDCFDKLGTEDRSKFYKLATTKKGEFHKGWSTAMLEESDFWYLLKTSHIIAQNITEQIVDGDISISPFAYGSKLACERCVYKPICRFDEMYNDYRVLDKISSRKAFLEIVNAIGGSYAN